MEPRIPGLGGMTFSMAMGLKCGQTIANIPANMLMGKKMVTADMIGVMVASMKESGKTIKSMALENISGRTVETTKVSISFFPKSDRPLEKQ
jgi:hypothetical protein